MSDTTDVSVWLSERLLDAVDAAADERDLTRAELIREYCREGTKTQIAD